jgi:hypothetical protein
MTRGPNRFAPDPPAGMHAPNLGSEPGETTAL